MPPRARTRLSCLLLVTSLGAGCGGDDGGGASPDAGPGADGGGGGDAGPGGCPRTAAPADRARFAVVSRPYDAASNRATTFEVLALSAAGALTRTSTTFEMGRASFGQIAFTPDGEVGLIAQEDGTLGVFRLDASGAPTVVHAGFTGSAYAGQVVMDPRGDRAWVIDGNTRGNDGGVSLVTIGCDGALTDHGQIVPADVPHGLVFTADGRALLGARAAAGAATAGHDVQLLSWGDAPAAVASVDAFPAEDPIVGGTALTADGTTFLVGNTSVVGTNSVAAVAVGAAGLTAGPVLEILDPQAITASPFGDVAIVSATQDDKLVILDRGGAGGSWRIRGNLPTTAANRLYLPGDHAPLTRGALRGHVLIAELTSVRHLAFGQDGAITDLGSLQFGDGVENITGAIGVQP